MVVENGARVSKILQVFSKQASLMDTLITVFVNQLKAKSNDETDKPDHQINDNGNIKNLLCNKNQIWYIQKKYLIIISS